MPIVGRFEREAGGIHIFSIYSFFVRLPRFDGRVIIVLVIGASKSSLDYTFFCLLYRIETLVYKFGCRSSGLWESLPSSFFSGQHSCRTYSRVYILLLCGMVRTNNPIDGTVHILVTHQLLHIQSGWKKYVDINFIYNVFLELLLRSYFIPLPYELDRLLVSTNLTNLIFVHNKLGMYANLFLLINCLCI